MCVGCGDESHQFFPTEVNHSEEAATAPVPTKQKNGRLPTHPPVSCEGCGKLKYSVETEGDCPQCIEAVRQYRAIKQKDRRIRLAAAGLCTDCGQHPAKEGQTQCIECSNKGTKYSAELYNKNKSMVFDHYGWSCVCCGENNEPFLSIDHIEGNGAEHRKELGTRSLYQWLVSNGFPDGFQTMCLNCNFAKKQKLQCPHHNDPNFVPFSQRQFEPFVFPF